MLCHMQHIPVYYCSAIQRWAGTIRSVVVRTYSSTYFAAPWISWLFQVHLCTTLWTSSALFLARAWRAASAARGREPLYYYSNAYIYVTFNIQIRGTCLKQQGKGCPSNRSWSMRNHVFLVLAQVAWQYSWILTGSSILCITQPVSGLAFHLFQAPKSNKFFFL